MPSPGRKTLPSILGALALTLTAPALGAHEGHGSLPAESAAHWLFEPLHLPGWILAAFVGRLVWRLLRREARARRRPRLHS